MLVFRKQRIQWENMYLIGFVMDCNLFIVYRIGMQIQ